MQTFEQLLAENAQLHRVGFYWIACGEHGKFRLLANGSVPDRCPRCGEPARLSRVRYSRLATSKPVPLVQRWKSDNRDSSPHTAPAWLRRDGQVETVG